LRAVFPVLLLAFGGLLLAAAPLGFRVGAFEFERPAGWEWIPPTGGMRKAQLAVRGGGDEVADVTFFHFGPGQGGGVEANVQRWFGQFRDATTGEARESVDGTEVVLVEAEGTFFSGMPGGPTTPMEGYGLRGAILVDEGGGDVFVKMTGPRDLVAGAREVFDAMVLAAAASR
jgi:hypothetical protein